MWSWQRSTDGATCYQISAAKLKNLIRNGDAFPLPGEFASMKLWEMLEAAARRAADVPGRKACVPCVYLGACKQQGEEWAAPRDAFEPDPEKFPEHAKRYGWASHAIVWYEWEHVRRTSSGGPHPHRICVRAHNVASDEAAL